MTEIPRDLDQFAEGATIEEIAELATGLGELGTEDALEALRQLLYLRGGSIIEKRFPAVLASRALIASGPQGVHILKRALLDDSGPRYRGTLMENLTAAASVGELRPDMQTAGYLPNAPTIQLSASIRASAQDAIEEIAAEAVVRGRVLELVAWTLQTMQFQNLVQRGTGQGDGPPGDEASHLLDALVHSTIRLAPSLIATFEDLLARHEREESYQQFLATNPALLDPLASRVVPKQKLGTEYATDFAIQRYDGAWLLVEIEKPQDSMFTRSDDFAAGFTHAYGQVLDFQSWVDDNIAYAREAMPGIASPRGVLVTGMRAGLSERRLRKLAQLNRNSARIEVLTFDDLAAQARTVYTNMRAPRS